MEYIIEGYNPESVFHHFEEIAAIPHGSGNEGELAGFIEKFAADRGLYCIRDDENNVFVRKDATAGYEDAPAVLLQGHLDMVCEKRAGVEHDFLHDGLMLSVENGMLRANGTTLGGDDGMAVAIMLSALDGTLEKHPKIECLFTTREEVGLVGASKFDASVITARKMINLDAANDGEAIVSCAGGARVDVTFPADKTDTAGVPITLTVKGLAGGHSGIDIDKHRASANKLMARILYKLSKKFDFSLASIVGGKMTNAITRECVATVLADSPMPFKEAARDIADTIAAELSREDAGFAFTAELAREETKKAFSPDETQRMIRLLMLLPYGVVDMSRDVAGLVESSANLGIVGTKENGLFITCYPRSSVDGRLDYIVDKISASAEACGGGARAHERYAGWKYESSSPLRDKYITIYKRLFGRAPRLVAEHAGLECGIIKGKLPDMDIIAIGATAKDVHSPDETLDLASLERLWQTVATLIAE